MSEEEELLELAARMVGAVFQFDERGYVGGLFLVTVVRPAELSEAKGRLVWLHGLTSQGVYTCRAGRRRELVPLLEAPADWRRA